MQEMNTVKLSPETEHRQIVIGAVDAERRRIVGLVLTAYGRAKLAGADSTAQVLDELATEIENS